MRHQGRTLAVLTTNVMAQVGAPKLPKAAGLYTPENILPSIIWKYTCGNCGLFVEPNKCAIISEEGGTDPGEINPRGYCVLWVPRPQEPAFSRWALMAMGKPAIEDPR